MNKALLKEDRVHGNPLYPVSVYDWDGRTGEPLINLHWHDELEFLTVTRGSARFRVGGQDFELRAGQAFFVNSGELHAAETEDPEGCAFHAVVFHPDALGGGRLDLPYDTYIQPLLSRRIDVPVVLTGGSAAERELLAMLGTVYQLNRATEPLYELNTIGLLHLMLARLLAMGGPAARERREPADHYRIDRLKTVIAYIQAGYAGPIRLRELAALVSMSEAHFCRFFKDMTTKSPMDYVNQFRVQKAAGLLKDTDKKIMEIALDVGFNSQSYFIGVFRGYFGATPSAYRRRVRTEN